MDQETILEMATDAAWAKAEAHLRSVLEKNLNDSLGVADYVYKTKPLKDRFDRGERTEELFEAIMRLN